MTGPALTVIIPVFQGRHRISGTLQALGRQRDAPPFETIVVDSGTDGCAEYVSSAFPWARVVESAVRLRPAAARNVGVEASRGAVLAFLPDDGMPSASWVRRRLEAHGRGADCVGGAVVAMRSVNPIALAEHLLEYSALMPKRSILEEQGVPHSLSFTRTAWDRVGPYDAGAITGEDTLLNRRCVELGMKFELVPEVLLRHAGSRTVTGYLRHAESHGRGLAQCIRDHGLPSSIPVSGTRTELAWSCLVRYPADGSLAKFRRLQRHALVLLPAFAVLYPLIALGLIATGAGAFRELAPRSRSHGTRGRVPRWLRDGPAE